MASTLLSHWRTSDNPSASIYETIRQDDLDEESDGSDVERRAGLYRYDDGSDDIPGRHGNYAGAAIPRSLDSPSALRPQRKPDNRQVRPKWMARGHKMQDLEEIEDDVPASLLIEGERLGLGPGSVALPPPPSATPSAEPRNLQQARSPTYATGNDRRSTEPVALKPAAVSSNPLASLDPSSRALWRWTNVVNLDNFLLDVYRYFTENGIYSILLSRTFKLLTSAFIVAFSFFMTQCIDYHSNLDHVSSLQEVLVPRCMRRMSWGSSLLLWLLVTLWIVKTFQYVADVRRLLQLRDFYLHLLGIPDSELQSVSWPEVVSRLMALRDSNPVVANNSATSRRYASQSKQRMDAHDIANRLMRQDNYMIAMINKDILDMTLPIPFLRNRQLFTRTLEWNLKFCIMDFLFNERGQMRTTFLKDTHRKELSEALRSRFIFAGTMNLIVAPFLIMFFLLQNFFSNFNEYQKNPGAIGSRDYTPFAEWKFREFNELGHLFRRRLDMSHPFASQYVHQFPQDKTIQMARFITFISGALISVLVLATVLDQENLLAMEITPGRSTIFYLGLFGGIWAVARGMIPEDNLVYDPAFAMQEVIDFTHYCPNHWHDRLHTVEVKREFEQLYQMKIFILAEEVLSMIFTPFVLWFSLPKCSDRIIDFFREFTVHVDGIGYVCSFAEFKFNAKKPADTVGRIAQTATSENRHTEEARDDYYASKDHKLEQSYWGFMNDYARNPKADVRFHYHQARKRVNMPPPVPGLPSPTMRSGFEIQATGPRNHVLSSQRGNPTGSQSLVHASSSPLQSMLLDAHHQPTAGFGASGHNKQKSNPLMQSKLRRRPVTQPEELREEDEEVIDDSQVDNKVSSAQLGSWKYEDERSDSSAEENEAMVAQEGAGVLGLMMRLQKNQSGHGRGAGI